MQHEECPPGTEKRGFVRVCRSTTCVCTHLGPEVNSRHKKQTTNHSCALLSSHWSCCICKNSFKNLWKLFKFMPPNVIFNQQHFCRVCLRKASDLCLWKLTPSDFTYWLSDTDGPESRGYSPTNTSPYCHSTWETTIHKLFSDSFAVSSLSCWRLE